MGLRISEAFGIMVGDVVDLGDLGLLAVQGQGGRIFSVLDDHGQFVAVPYTPTLKTAAGCRVPVVLAALMAANRVALDAFHTDPYTGEVDQSGRLVPGTNSPTEQARPATKRPSARPLLQSTSPATISASGCPPTCYAKAPRATSPGKPASKSRCAAGSWDIGPATTCSGASTPSTIPTSLRSPRLPRCSTTRSRTASARC